MGVCMTINRTIGNTSISKRQILSTAINLPEEEKKQADNFYQKVGERKKVKKKGPIGDIRSEVDYTADAPSAQITDKAKNLRDCENIRTSLGRHFIFNSLTDEQREMVIDQMKHYTLGPNSIIFEQSQPGNNFFVVSTGKLEVLVNNKRVNVLRQGDSFGELALLHDTPRSATVKTIERSTLWGVDRKTFRSAVEGINSLNYQENLQFIESIPIFKILTPQQKDSLVSSLSIHNFNPQQKIVNEGDPGDLCYIIKEGTVACSKDGVEIRTMGKGDYFGEQSLLHNCLRTASITASSPVKCLAIGRESLTKVLGNKLQHIIYVNSQRIALEKSPHFARLTKEQIENVIKNIKISTFLNGQTVNSTENEKGKFLWVLLKGSLRNQAGELLYRDLVCIGDAEIIKEPEEGNYGEIIAVGDVVVGVTTRADFESAIGGPFHEVILKNDALHVLKKVNILRELPNDKIFSLLNELKIEEFEDHQVIFRENDPGDSFFIVKHGKVDVMKNNIYIRTITKHDYFGERSILFNETRTATITAKGHVSCWVLHQQDFLNAIDDKIRTLLLKRIQLQDNKVQIDDLSMIRTLGKGMFGIVFLVMHRDKQTNYALKTVSRKKIDRFNIQENLVLERKVLMQLDHIMILKLIKTFKDEKRIYFLTEYVKGQDLFDVLRQMGIVSERDSRFYFACLVAILEHLHERDIIYRDLKPENVMIDEDGYPKLIDFGTAKIVQGRTYTVVGTPHYMAPEIVTGKGYGIAADYWSLGIMLYEFLCGGVPFAENEEDPCKVYEKVQAHVIEWPSWIDQNLSAKPLIEQLLNKNPSLRNGGSTEKLKASPWLCPMNWEKLLSKQLTPPFVPPADEMGMDRFLANVPMDEFISAEEASTEIPKGPKRRKNHVSPNWDADF